LYTEDNVCISGTHTHSGPGGYWQYVLFEVTSLGFVEENFNVIVDGIVESIKIGMIHTGSCIANVNMCDMICYFYYISPWELKGWITSNK